MCITTEKYPSVQNMRKFGITQRVYFNYKCQLSFKTRCIGAWFLARFLLLMNTERVFSHTTQIYNLLTFNFGLG